MKPTNEHMYSYNLMCPFSYIILAAVLVSHGGTEMGQGLHTKVCQVAAQAFGIPLTDVYINDTSSDKVANSIPTAASMSTDMYGMATLDACSQILKRIAPIRETLGPDATLREGKYHTAII
jgi:xanthine dehydrogenase/oxidase